MNAVWPSPANARRPRPNRIAAQAWAVLWMTAQLLKVGLSPTGATGRLPSVVHVCHNARISLDWLFVNIVRNFGCKPQRAALDRLEAWSMVAATLPLPTELIARIKGYVWPTVTIRCARSETVGHVRRLVAEATDIPDDSRGLFMANRLLSDSCPLARCARGASGVHLELRHLEARPRLGRRVFVDVLFGPMGTVTWQRPTGVHATVTRSDLARVADGWMQPLRFSNKVAPALEGEPRQFAIDIGRSGSTPDTEKAYRKEIVRQVARFEWGAGPDIDPLCTMSRTVRRLAFLEADRMARAALALPGPVSLQAPCGLAIHPVGNIVVTHVRIKGSVTAGEFAGQLGALTNSVYRMCLRVIRDEQWVTMPVPENAPMARVFLGAGARGHTGTPACEPISVGQIMLVSNAHSVRLDLINVGIAPIVPFVAVTSRHRPKYVYT